MARLRYNNALGTLGGSLTNNGTTITFAVAPAFATIVAPDYIPLVLEPPAGSAASANFEIVYLTAYIAGATTGTITRGREGTTGVSHSNAVTWVHGPLVADGANTAYHDAVMADSPISYWRLSDVTGTTFADVQGVNALTITTGSGTTQLQKGSMGLVPSSEDLAAFFGGGAHAVNSSPASIPNAAPFTFECWLNLFAPLSGGLGVFQTATSGGWWLAVADNSNSSRLNFTTKGIANYFTTHYPIRQGVPAHIVIVFDTSFAANYYINGQFLETVTGAANPSAASGSLQLSGGAGGSDFIGTLDEVAVYNSALSAARIAAHYSAAVA